jgi:hypothetical protein
MGGGGGGEVVCNGTHKLAIIDQLSIMGCGFKSLLEQSSTYLLILPSYLKHQQ